MGLITKSIERRTQKSRNIINKTEKWFFDILVSPVLRGGQTYEGNGAFYLTKLVQRALC